MRQGGADREVDCKRKAVLPGLVDGHTHAVHAGDRSLELEAKLSGVPYAHAEHCSAVLSSPDTIDRLVDVRKCGSKYTTVSAGAVSLANRFTAADTDSTPLSHCTDHRVTSSLLFAFACQK